MVCRDKFFSQDVGYIAMSVNNMYYPPFVVFQIFVLSSNEPILNQRSLPLANSETSVNGLDSWWIHYPEFRNCIRVLNGEILTGVFACFGQFEFREQTLKTRSRCTSPSDRQFTSTVYIEHSTQGDDAAIPMPKFIWFSLYRRMFCPF